MSDKKSLLIGFAGTGKTVQKTLTNIKQDASPVALKTFAEKLGSLSDDTVDSIAVVERTDITNATAPPTKPKLSLTFYDQPQLDSPTAEVLFNEELPSFVYKFTDGTHTLSRAGLSFYRNGPYVQYSLLTGQGLTEFNTVTATLYFDETETTAATAVQLTINYNTAPVLTIL